MKSSKKIWTKKFENFCPKLQGRIFQIFSFIFWAMRRLHFFIFEISWRLDCMPFLLLLNTAPYEWEVDGVAWCWYVNKLYTNIHPVDANSRNATTFSLFLNDHANPLQLCIEYGSWMIVIIEIGWNGDFKTSRIQNWVQEGLTPLSFYQNI